MTATSTTSATLLGGAVSVTNGTVQVHDAAALATSRLDPLVHQAVCDRVRDWWASLPGWRVL
ncbi:MAG: hypothetical protein K2Y26_01655, partial [Gemmatimonadaceae bacterium]|nr:hypothetical protein [Gemmatimonadaceae bacterium]